MSRKQQYFFISMMMLLVTVTCQASGNPVPTPTARSTQSATGYPVFTPSIPTVSMENDLRTVFPSFSLTDPNAVCVAHYYYALSCVDASGWHIYKNEYDEVSHPTSTIPRYITRCPDGRIYLVDDEIYQVEGEMLTGIGGWVDQGAIICGRGNDFWVSDFSEVMRFDGSTWTSYTVEDYFESSNRLIYSLAVAPNGNAWVTTDNTLATFDGVEWEVLTPPGNYYFMESFGSSEGLAIDSNGVVWVVAYPENGSGDDQLLRFDGSEWSVYPAPYDEDSLEMNIITADRQGGIWAATDGNKIFTLDPETKEWELRFDVEQLGSRNEWEVRFDSEQLGLGFGENRIDQMEFDGQGRLWVTTNYGLGIFDGATWTIYHTYTADLYMNDITALSILGDGPPLPALESKPFGSIRGKLVSKTQTPFIDAYVRVCFRTGTGMSFCAGQFEPVNADGSFLISNVPPGTYKIDFKISNESFDLEYAKGGDVICTVKEGEEIQLGEITAP